MLYVSHFDKQIYGRLDAMRTYRYDHVRPDYLRFTCRWPGSLGYAT